MVDAKIDDNNINLVNSGKFREMKSVPLELPIFLSLKNRVLIYLCLNLVISIYFKGLLQITSVDKIPPKPSFFRGQHF